MCKGFTSEVLKFLKEPLGSYPCRDLGSQETSAVCLVYVLISVIATCSFSTSKADVTLTFGAAPRSWLQFCSPCCGDMLHSAKTRTYSGTHVKRNHGLPLWCRGIQLPRASLTRAPLELFPPQRDLSFHSDIKRGLIFSNQIQTARHELYPQLKHIYWSSWAPNITANTISLQERGC